MRRLALFAFLLAASLGAAQAPKGNPLVEAAHALGAQGLGAASLDKAPNWPFKPTGARIYVKDYVAALGVGAEEQGPLERSILTIIDGYEDIAKDQGQANDPAFALAFAVSALVSVAKGTQFDDAALLALAPRLRATLAKTSTTDRQKQEFYEYALSASGMVAVLNAATKEPEARKNLQTIAEARLLELVGAKSDAVVLKGETVSIGAPAVASALKADFPADWRQDGVWRIAEKRDGTVASAAQVRLVPPVPAKGSFADALRDAWKRYVPAELGDKASGMVFRRYVGDGLVANFICGASPEKDRKWDTLFTVYLVDCGATWQPIVVAQTWNDSSTKFPIFSPWTISGSFRETAPFVETFLKGLSCPAAKGKPLVDKAALVGTYKYGTASSLQYENVYTGATSMSTVSYGGTLALLPTGKFTEDYSSAAGMVGNLKFRGFKAKGDWTLNGDILTLTDTFYDQGDAYKRPAKKYRVAGVVAFADGVKVLVLKGALDVPINPMTVGDKTEYYSSEKK